MINVLEKIIKSKNKKINIASIIFLAVIIITEITLEDSALKRLIKESLMEGVTAYSIDDVPEYERSPYFVLNNNRPEFDTNLDHEFEKYGELDIWGRCTGAFAKLGVETLPTEERGPIGHIKPSGWNQKKYPGVVDSSPAYLYNRCHLIGYQLAGENANERNLITGTRYFNVEGMLPFENIVREYIDNTQNHVLYKVTPIYDGYNLLAKGVTMEAWSVEDDGEGVCFNVFVYNVQPGVEIDYSDGRNWIE